MYSFFVWLAYHKYTIIIVFGLALWIYPYWLYFGGKRKLAAFRRRFRPRSWSVELEAGRSHPDRVVFKPQPKPKPKPSPNPEPKQRAAGQGKASGRANGAPSRPG